MTRENAIDLLKEAEQKHPGKWISHSFYVAEVAERIAKRLNLDSEKAYVAGLLHDIGRREGSYGFAHIIDGYHYLKELGEEELGRYCLTHSYFIKDVHATCDQLDIPEKEINWIQNYLDQITYNIYDKLVQIGDCIGSAEGFTLIESRLTDVHLRKGVNEYTIPTWKAIFQLQNEIEELLGSSIYQLFPEIKETIDTKMVKKYLTF